MKKLSADQRGLIPMLILLITVIVMAIVFVFLRVRSNQQY